MFELADLYLSDLSATRGDSPAVISGTAKVTFGVSEPVLRGTEVLVATSLHVALGGDAEGSTVAELDCEYVAEVRRADSPWTEGWEAETDLVALVNFAQTHLYPRQRERVMELTLRMGVPVFKMPLTMPEMAAEMLHSAEDEQLA